jgi:hypothetical protein
MWKAEDDELLADEDEDAENVERAEAFEYKYNFRFEEEGGDQVRGLVGIVGVAPDVLCVDCQLSSQCGHIGPQRR